MFFEKLSKLLNDDTLIISVQKLDDKLTVSIMPKVKGDVKLVPITVTGRPHELDAELVDAIADSLKTVQNLFINSEAFVKSAQKAVKEAEEKASSKTKKEEKKPEPKKEIAKPLAPAEEAKKLNAEAIEAMKGELYDDALTLFEKAAKLDPKQKDAHNIMQCKIKLKAEEAGISGKNVMIAKMPPQEVAKLPDDEVPPIQDEVEEEEEEIEDFNKDEDEW